MDVIAEARMNEKEIVSLCHRAEQEGKADHAWRCELVDVADEVVAVVEGVFQLRMRESR